MGSQIPPPSASPTYAQSYAARAAQPFTPAMTSYLLNLMQYKKSNLCLSADVSTTAQLLDVAEEVGSNIVMLKTHADIISDFSERTIRGLVAVAAKKKFLIFEDRKFGDIGNTVQLQYGAGSHRIANWAHYVNAHIFPGPAIIAALRSTAFSALAASQSTISTSITSGGPLIEEDLNRATEELKNTFLATRRRGRSRIDENGDGDDNSPADGELKSPLSNGLNKSGITARSDDDEMEEVRLRRESQILRKPSVVSISTTITSTTEYISPPATGTATSFGSVSLSSADETPTSMPAPPLARGMLLLAQMSSKDNLLDAAYTSACLEHARQNRDFVLGFVAQQTLNVDPDDNFVTFTPGIQLPPADPAAELDRAARTAARITRNLTDMGLPADILDGPPRAARDAARGDGLGQQYNTPRKAVFDNGCDVVIVGRGILNATDREAEAERYRAAGWAAYLERIGRAP